MKRSFLMILSVCALGCGISLAQPPGGLEGRPPRDGAGPREGGPREHGQPPHNPLMDALDPDHDHVISADEIKSAIAALLKLDKNKDGQLTEDEFRPEHQDGFGPPPPPEGDAGSGRPPREAGDRPRSGPPGGEGRGPGGPPDPASFVEHVMEFDANKDGLLSKEELMKFAEEGMHRGGPGGPGQQRGPREGGDRPEGNRGESPRPVRPARPEIE